MSLPSMNEIDGVSIKKLIGEYGTPLFVVSAKILRNNFKKFRQEFSNKYPKVGVAYSYKANYLLGVIDLIHKEGGLAEVASGFEYEIARKIGVPGKSIVFNGPYKRNQELKRAIEDGAIINVDNKYELELIEDIASDINKPVEIGIRINTDVGIHQLPDRFGFNLESGEALEVVNSCCEKKRLRIAGLHIHLTSYVLQPGEFENFMPAKNIKLIWPKSSEMYRSASERLVKFAQQIRNRFGITLKYLDMGGGFPEVDSLTPYVRAIVEPILDVFKNDEPLLILEPGRAIVKNAVHLITTVVDVKEMTNEKRRVTLDAGINLLPTSLWSLQEFEVVTNSNENLKETMVYGPLCLQTDIVGIVKLPELKIGDNIIIKNIGAYNIPQSSSFIFPRPFIVLIDDGDEELNLLTPC